MARASKTRFIWEKNNNNNNKHYSFNRVLGPDFVGARALITAASGSSRVQAFFRSTEGSNLPKSKPASSSDRVLIFTKQSKVISPALILYKEGVRPITTLVSSLRNVCSLSVLEHSKSRQSYFLVFWGRFNRLIQNIHQVWWCWDELPLICSEICSRVRVCHANLWNWWRPLWSNF